MRVCRDALVGPLGAGRREVSDFTHADPELPGALTTRMRELHVTIGVRMHETTNPPAPILRLFRPLGSDSLVLRDTYWFMTHLALRPPSQEPCA